VVFSPNGWALAWASGETIKLWDARTGANLRSLTGHTGDVQTVKFSPDGARLASASWDNTIKLWDVHTGVELRTLTGHAFFVNSVVFSPDGARLASASWDNTIKLWDAHTGSELRTLAGHSTFINSAVNSAEFSPDGKRLAWASADKTIKLWDSGAGTELRTLTGHSSYVKHVVFSPDGARLFSRDDKGQKLAWDARTAEAVAWPADAPDFHSNQNRSPDGKWLAISYAKSIRLVDLTFKDMPDEKAYREFKARLDPWWHNEQAETAMRNAAAAVSEQQPADAMRAWYSATFHLAWLLKARPDDVAAGERLTTAYDNWKRLFAEHLKASTPAGDSPLDADIYLAPAVCEALQRLPRT
jgi:WD40 repeat protein